MPLLKRAALAAVIASAGLMGGTALSATTAEAATAPTHVTASAPSHIQTLSQDGWGWGDDWGWGGGWNSCWW